MTSTMTSAEAPLQAALDIARALSARGIRFVHWKSNGHLAEALSGRTDIDMFADPAQRDAVRDMPARAGLPRGREPALGPLPGRRGLAGGR